MKKKVLFALIALFSFVSAWAADPSYVEVDGYKVYLTNNLVVINTGATSATAPTFATGVEHPVKKEGVTITNPTIGATVYSYNGTTKALSEVSQLNQIGNYYLQVAFTESTGSGQDQVSKNIVIYVPFTVGKEIKLWQVYGKTSWYNALGDQTSMLSSYYHDYPQFELWNSAGNNGQGELATLSKEAATAALAMENTTYSHDFKAQLASQANYGPTGNEGAHPFPYLGFTFTEAGSHKVVVRRPVAGQTGQTFDVPWLADSRYGYVEGDNTVRQRSFVSLATEGELLNNLGITGNYSKGTANDYDGFGVTLDMRQYLDAPANTIPNDNYGEAFKYVNGVLQDGTNNTEVDHAKTLAEAVVDPSLLNDMQLIAIPEANAAQLAPSTVILSTDNTTVTVTPKGANRPITATSEYTYPGVGTTTDNTVVPPTTRGNFTVVVECNGVTLTEGVDYNITWKQSEQGNKPYEDAGTWPIDITGAGIYTTTIDDPQSSSPLQSKITVNYVVNKASSTPKDATLKAASVEYNGNETNLSAEAVATISYKTEGETPTTVTKTVKDYLAANRTAVTKYVYAGDTKPAAGTLVEGTEEAYPSHVGFWQMRLKFAAADANHEESYVSDIFEVTPTQLAMHLGIINWPFGKDYPEINKLYYSIAKSEYAPGDGTNNVAIEGMGVVWPYEQIGSQQSEVPVGSPVGSYRWNLAPGQVARAVTTFGNQKYENYYVVVHNDNAIINIGKSGLIIGVNQDQTRKTYGFEDPTFRPVIKNANCDLVYSYTKDKDGNVKATDANGQPIDLTAAEVIANEDLQDELAEMATIYKGVAVTRDGGIGDTPRKEDVTTEGYQFKATLSEDLTSSYNITNTEGKFFIDPYDLAKTYKADGSEWKEGTDDPSKKTASKFEITVDDVTYNGKIQKPAVAVVFHHDVKEVGNNGDITLYAADDPATTVVEQISYSVGTYNNSKNVSRGTDWSVEQNKATVEVIAAETNKNIEGTKLGYFTVNPAKLSVKLKTAEKVYGQHDEDVEGLLTCEITGFVTVGANTEDPAHPTTDPLVEGVYYGEWEAPVAKRQGAWDPEYEVVGTYAITATGGKARNYYFDRTTPGQLTITKATLTVHADPFIYDEDDEPDFESPITYGDHIYFDVTATGYVLRPGLTKTDANLLGEAKDAVDDIYDPQDNSQDPAYGKITIGSTNAGQLSWAFTNADGTPELDNYKVVYDRDYSGEIKPNQNGLWITIDPKSKTYGTTDPELTYTAKLDGEEIDLEDLLLPEEEFEGIVLSRTPGSNAGQYDIVFGEGEGEGEAEGPATIGNYKINYDVESGIRAFTINKATLFVKATVVYPQLLDDENKPMVDKNGNAVRATSIPYGEEIGLAYKNEFPGYAIVEFKNHISSESGMAGSGLVEGDIFEDVINEKIFDANGNPGNTNCVNDFVEYTCDYEDEPNVGKFTVSAEGPEAKNYIISYNDGVKALEVVAAQLTIKAKNQTIYYNDLVEFDADGNGKYNTPAIIDDVETKVEAVGAPLPKGVNITDLVESISCDETSVGVHTGAIKIKSIPNDLVNPVYQDGTLTVKPLTEIHLAYENVDQALEDHKGYEDYEGEEGLSVYLPARELRADTWTAFSLPFEFRAPELSNQLFYGVIDVLDESDASENYKFTEVVNGKVAANQPFILKVAAEDASVKKGEIAMEAEDVANVCFTNVIIPAEDADENEFVYNDDTQWPFRADAYGNKFVGQYTGKTGLAASEWAISSNPSSKNLGKFVYGGDKLKDVYFEPTVAFLQNKDNVANADLRIIIEENGTLTDINAVDAEADAEVAEGWYTITGIKLEAKPTEKGVYIYNGKKVSIQ